MLEKVETIEKTARKKSQIYVLPQYSTEKKLCGDWMYGEWIEQLIDEPNTIRDILGRIRLSIYEGDISDALNSFKYYSNSACWPESDMDSLVTMIAEAVLISRRAFQWYVNAADLRLLEELLGYGVKRVGFDSEMVADYRVNYYMGIVHGEVVYFCRHLEIDYIFKKG